MADHRPASREFWRDKRVMVTGGHGFLGKNIVRQLQKHGAAHVFVADLDRYDLRRLQDIRRALSDSQPHVVIHLAARVGGIGAMTGGPRSEFTLPIMLG